MSVKIVKKTLTNSYFSFNAMAILPSPDENASYKGQWGVFTHGYTASKRDCLPWAQRLAESGAPCVFFDLPGHYLGGYHEVESFEDFKAHVHECFIDAYKFLAESLNENDYDIECTDVIFGGHSLGAMLSLKALELPYFSQLNKMAICIGLGIGQHKETHLFESSFYQKTLDIRRQLVSPSIDSDLVFPWIKEAKLSVTLTDQRIHLICGIDDVVVGEGGMKALEFNLVELGNTVTSIEPKKLPHHEPTMAATYVNSFLRKEFNW